MSYVSKCCTATVKVVGDVTKYYLCSNCDKPCDIKEVINKAIGV